MVEEEDWVVEIEVRRGRSIEVDSLGEVTVLLLASLVRTSSSATGEDSTTIMLSLLLCKVSGLVLWIWFIGEIALKVSLDAAVGIAVIVSIICWIDATFVRLTSSIFRSWSCRRSTVASLESQLSFIVKGTRYNRYELISKTMKMLQLLYLRVDLCTELTHRHYSRRKKLLDYIKLLFQTSHLKWIDMILS